MDFSLTDDRSCCATPRASCSTASARPRSCARTSTTRRRTSRCGGTCASTPRSAPGPRTDLCLFLEQTGYVAAPGRSSPTALLRVAHRRRRRRRTGTVAFARRRRSNPFVLEADRVDAIAVVGPGPSVARRRHRRGRATGCASSRPSTSPAASFQLDTARRSTSTPQPLDAGRARRRGATARTCRIAAEMVGTARRIFDMALAYAKERKQFDVPIGSFQAIQHKLADMSLALERATAAVQYAAMTVDADDARPHARAATSPRPRPAKRRAASSRTASRSTAASATRGSTTCTSTSGAPPPTSTCSAPRAGTTTASPTCCSPQPDTVSRRVRHRRYYT